MRQAAFWRTRWASARHCRQLLSSTLFLVSHIIPPDLIADQAEQSPFDNESSMWVFSGSEMLACRLTKASARLWLSVPYRSWITGRRSSANGECDRGGQGAHSRVRPDQLTVVAADNTDHAVKSFVGSLSPHAPIAHSQTHHRGQHVLIIGYERVSLSCSA